MINNISMLFQQADNPLCIVITWGDTSVYIYNLWSIETSFE